MLICCFFLQAKYFPTNPQGAKKVLDFSVSIAILQCLQLNSRKRSVYYHLQSALELFDITLRAPKQLTPLLRVFQFHYFQFEYFQNDDTEKSLKVFISVEEALLNLNRFQLTTFQREDIF